MTITTHVLDTSRGRPAAGERRVQGRGGRGPLPRPAPAQPVWIQHVPRELKSMSVVLGPNNYGKSEVRLVKVDRGADRHELRDLTVDVALSGDFEAAHVRGDNTGLLATDTMRNTVYALARQNPVDSPESFAIALVKHFLDTAP